MSRRPRSPKNPSKPLHLESEKRAISRPNLTTTLRHQRDQTKRPPVRATGRWIQLQATTLTIKRAYAVTGIRKVRHGPMSTTTPFMGIRASLRDQRKANRRKNLQVPTKTWKMEKCHQKTLLPQGKSQP